MSGSLELLTDALYHDSKGRAADLFERAEASDEPKGRLLVEHWLSAGWNFPRGLMFRRPHLVEMAGRGVPTTVAFVSLAGRMYGPGLLVDIYLYLRAGVDKVTLRSLLLDS